MSAREERHAEFIAEMRTKHPMLGDAHWNALTEQARMQWQIDDLRSGLAHLVGGYGWRSEQDPGNTDLAELVAELKVLLESGTRQGVTS
jgi:hypothetical protein